MKLQSVEGGIYRRVDFYLLVYVCVCFTLQVSHVAVQARVQDFNRLLSECVSVNGPVGECLPTLVSALTCYFANGFVGEPRE